MVDKESNKSRGFGFIIMQTYEAAEEILQLSYLFLDNKKIECKLALPKAELE